MGNCLISGGQITEKVDKKSTPELVQSVRHLLATMYKVLVLADSVIVSDIMLARDKVGNSTISTAKGYIRQCQHLQSFFINSVGN